MRLINGDELREMWLNNGLNEHIYDTNDVLDSIDAAPTIDPVKREPCDFCKRYNFANARVEVNKYGAYICLAGGDTQFPMHEQFNFCPVCGRRLADGNEKEATHD